MNGVVCAGPQCDREGRGAHGLCDAHVRQWTRNGRNMDRLKPVRPPSVTTPADDVDEFEWLLQTGATVHQALVRMGLSARTMQRRYRHVGRPTPAGLCTAAKLTAAELRAIA